MRKLFVLLGVLLVAGAVGAIVYFQGVDRRGASEVDELVLYGNVDIREVRLAFNGSEHVERILVEEGDRVQAGQLLATLQTDRLRATARRAQAEVAALEAEAHAAELSYARVKALAARDLASQEEADEAEGKSLAAAARVVAAQAALAETQQALEDANIHAPNDGIIRERIVEPGDFVTPQTPVLTLSLVDPVWVRTYIPETYLGKVKPGAVARIRTDSFPAKDYQAWVGSISPTAEFTPKNVQTPQLRTRLVYQARVFACNPELELRLGMPATVIVPLDQEPRSIAEPSERCARSTAEQ